MRQFPRRWPRRARQIYALRSPYLLKGFRCTPGRRSAQHAALSELPLTQNSPAHARNVKVKQAKFALEMGGIGKLKRLRKLRRHTKQPRAESISTAGKISWPDRPFGIRRSILTPPSQAAL